GVRGGAGGARLLRGAARALHVERRERADLVLARRDRGGARVDRAGRRQHARLDAGREIERGEHHAVFSISATSQCVGARANGSDTKAVTAAGQPTIKACLQPPTKSDPNPIWTQVTTPPTANTMIAVIASGKMNLALPSIGHCPRVG